MKILSVAGENVPTGKGGSPADTFDRSEVTYQVGNETKTLTLTYVRYFASMLAEQGKYDQEAGGVPVNRIAGVLFLEQNPNVKESRHYISDADQFLQLFEGFSVEDFRAKYSALTLA